MSRRNKYDMEGGNGSRPYVQTVQRTSPTSRSYSSHSSYNSPSSLNSANSIYLNAPYKVKEMPKPDSKAMSVYSDSESMTQPNEYGVICDSRVCENGFSLKDQHEEVIAENEEANEKSEYSYYTNGKVSGLDCEIHCHIRTTLGLFIKVNVCPNRTRIIHELLLAPTDLDHLQILDKCMKPVEEEENDEENCNNRNSNVNNSNYNNRVDFAVQTGMEEEKEEEKEEKEGKKENENENEEKSNKEISPTVETEEEDNKEKDKENNNENKERNNEEGERESNNNNNENQNTELDYDELCKYISKCLAFNAKGHLVCVTYSDERKRQEALLNEVEPIKQLTVSTKKTTTTRTTSKQLYNTLSSTKLYDDPKPKKKNKSQFFFANSKCSPTKRFMDEFQYQYDRLDYIMNAPHPVAQKDEALNMKREAPGPAFKVYSTKNTGRKSRVSTAASRRSSILERRESYLARRESTMKNQSSSSLPPI